MKLSLALSTFFIYGVASLHISFSQEGSDNSRMGPTEIISEIRSILDQTISEYQNNNISGASDLADKAYLDKYEFIEAPLSKQNKTLMKETEIMLREDLRELIKSKEPLADIQTLVEKINLNLNQADVLLGNQTKIN